MTQWLRSPRAPTGATTTKPQQPRSPSRFSFGSFREIIWIRPEPETRSTRPTHSPRFSFSSLKDIHDIIREEPVPEPGSPKGPAIFHRIKLSSSSNRRHSLSPLSPTPIPDADHSVVIYFTSLRVIRKTFEECRTVRSILRGLRVPIDERDLSLDSKFLEELVGIFGQKNLSLPKVFIGGRFVGGAEEIKKLHESGDLYRLIGGLPLVGPSTCDACDGLGFTLCDQCNGSHKIYTGKTGFRSCDVCNVNGLIRCPSCCPTLGRSRSTISQ